MQYTYQEIVLKKIKTVFSKSLKIELKKKVIFFNSLYLKIFLNLLHQVINSST